MSSVEKDTYQKTQEGLQDRKNSVFSILRIYPAYRRAALKAFHDNSQLLSFSIGKTSIRMVNNNDYLFLQTQSPIDIPNHFDSWVISVDDTIQIVHKTIRHEDTNGGIALGGIPVAVFDVPTDSQEALAKFAESLGKPSNRRLHPISQPAVA